jgi:HAE1 family hydrophobic/amphiphilic exporter-1
MTTFALIAGMMPVAIGVGEGGEFYRPMAVAIIGGTLTATMLTLLVVPTFYDSIEISRDRAIAKFRRRAGAMNPAFAFVLTFFEAIFTLLLAKAVWRGARRLFSRGKPAAGPVVLDPEVRAGD